MLPYRTIQNGMRERILSYIVFGYDRNEKRPNRQTFGSLFPMVADGFYSDIEEAKSSMGYFQELHPALSFCVLEAVKVDA